jgi:hypothetical protein
LFPETFVPKARNRASSRFQDYTPNKFPSQSTGPLKRSRTHLGVRIWNIYREIGYAFRRRLVYISVRKYASLKARSRTLRIAAILSQVKEFFCTVLFRVACEALLAVTRAARDLEQRLLPIRRTAVHFNPVLKEHQG